MFMLSICQAREIVKSLKKDYGFTYNQIAEIISVSANHLYHFLSNDRGLRRDKIFLLEKFLIDNNLIQEETINELLHNQN